MPDIPIIDAHAHVIPQVCGRNRFGELSPMRNGRVRRGREDLPLLPPHFADCTFPVEALVELMDREGVGKAVLLQNPTLGTCNDYIRDCVERFPERFCGTIQVDPRAPEAAATIRKFASAKQRTLKLEMSFDWGWTGLHPDFRIDEPGMEPVWRAVMETGMEVIIDPGPPGNPGYQVEAFAGLAGRMPDTRFVIEHMGYLTAAHWDDAGARARRRQLLELGQRPNVWLGLSAVPILLDDPYPCARVLELLREAVAMVGAEKLLWGSDLPITLNRHTYRQLVDTVFLEAPFLSQEDRERILGGNAVTVFSGLTRIKGNGR
jgi:hypothetical protein